MGQQPRTSERSAALPPIRRGTQGRRWVNKKTNGRTVLEGARSVKWVGKSEFLGYGRESGSRSPMRKEAEAKLIISFQSQQEKTAMLYLLRPTRKDRYLLTMKIKWAQSSNLPFKTDLKSYINFRQIGEGRLCKEWVEAELQNAKSSVPLHREDGVRASQHHVDAIFTLNVHLHK